MRFDARCIIHYTERNFANFPWLFILVCFIFYLVLDVVVRDHAVTSREKGLPVARTAHLISITFFYNCLICHDTGLKSGSGKLRLEVPCEPESWDILPLLGGRTPLLDCITVSPIFIMCTVVVSYLEHAKSASLSLFVHYTTLPALWLVSLSLSFSL